MSDIESQQSYMDTLGGAVNVDEVVGASARIPVGRYPMRLIDVDGKESKKGYAMVECRLEVQASKAGHEGEDQLIWFSLIVMAPKKKGQRPFAPGIVEAKAAFAAAGAPLPAGFAFPLDPTAAKKVVAKHLGKKILDVVVVEERKIDKETGDEIVNTRAKIVGVWKGEPAAAHALGAAAATAAAPAPEPEDDEDDYL
jgi:hypothetical protein